MTVYIDGSEYDGAETRAGESINSDNVEQILWQIISSFKDKLQSNQVICITIDMEFDPVSEEEFLNVLPVGPYTPFVGPGYGE